MLKYRWVGIVLLGVTLAGCNFGHSENPQPTLETPVAEVPTQAATEATNLPEASPSAAATPFPAPTDSVSLAASSTPPPTFTVNPTAPPTFTPGQIFPTQAETAVIMPTQVAPPTIVPILTVTPGSSFGAVQPTNTPVSVAENPPAVPLPAAQPSAQVCATCGQLRLRENPGTAGAVLTTLEANTPVTIIGRTEDNKWVQITLVDARNGWVASRYLDINIDLSLVSVTGVAEDVPAPPAAEPPGGSAIISGITAHSRQIFLDGQAKGNRANVFSKVGDSITFAPYFMHQLASDYRLGEYSYLAPALRFFYGPNARGENSFSASSLAAMPGWSTVTQLTPGKSTSPLCSPTETPLVCEFRTARPSVALIMLGTIDSEGFITLDQYRANLEQVVQITIDMGIIPVLSTIPPLQVEQDRVERGVAINGVIVATARKYDIPLWDYYTAMINLPDKGLSGDGGHPSEPPDGKHAYFDAEHLQYGYPMRNLTGLQMLYELWRQVLYDGGTDLPPGPPQPTPTVVDVAPSDPGTYTCPGTLPIRLAVGGQGRITPGVPNKVRNAPGLAGTQVGKIDGGEVFQVIGGPHCADGYTWWQVNYNGLEGWTPSGSASEYWVEPYP